jgi:hypothetical protein
MNDVSATSPSPPDTSPPPRLLSVDALRGFDMFWIIGGEQVAKALEVYASAPTGSIIRK